LSRCSNIDTERRSPVLLLDGQLIFIHLWWHC